MDVHIEHLPPLRVAALSAREPDAETAALDGILNWARAHGYLSEPYRLFGYDNCLPGPQHRYTAWLTVGLEAIPDHRVQIIDFSGGRYAVLRVTGVEQIKAGWDRLASWVRHNRFRLARQPGLEEHLHLPDAPTAQFTLDLYLALVG
ncbi:MAG: GyrI-like domain-containing protein [Anaerolineae bacterium]|nr:GyrI-like domain-containing protein [Anaerolineae bacterium]